MINDDSIPSAGANADSELQAEVSTSSSNDTKPHVEPTPPVKVYQPYKTTILAFH